MSPSFKLKLLAGTGAVILALASIPFWSGRGDARRRLHALQAAQDRTSQREAAARKVRTSDSVKALGLIAKTSNLTADDWLAADSLIHYYDLGVDHSAVHHWVADLRLTQLAGAVEGLLSGLSDTASVRLRKAKIVVPLTDSQHARFAGLDRLTTQYTASVAAAERDRATVARQREHEKELAQRLSRVRQSVNCRRPNSAKMKSLLIQHESWDDIIIASVACGLVYQGMTEEQVSAALGRPTDVVITTGAFGTSETRVYTHQRPNRSVHLMNGRVEAVQYF